MWKKNLLKQNNIQKSKLTDSYWVIKDWPKSKFSFCLSKRDRCNLISLPLMVLPFFFCSLEARAAARWAAWVPLTTLTSVPHGFLRKDSKLDGVSHGSVSDLYTASRPTLNWMHKLDARKPTSNAVLEQTVQKSQGRKMKTCRSRNSKNTFI